MNNIKLENDNFNSLKDYFERQKYSSVFVLVDENTKKNCLDKIKDHIEVNSHIIEIISGEENKNISTASYIWKKMMEFNADRNSIIINLGGGVITDLGGFIASTFKRGIKYINIPTTLLSMVDASLGGKTGINLNMFKNQIGTFYNPDLVLININFLDTLPSREKKSGIAEIIKHALISNYKQWQEIKNKNDYNEIINSDIIYKSIQIKNEVVQKDPLESGYRKILNFGHTIGHALETFFLDKTPILHGEAVACGIVCESFLSNLDDDDLMEIKKFINNIFPKIQINTKYYQSIIEIMKHDKKNKHYKEISFSTLKNIGYCDFDVNIDDALIKKSFDFYNSINN